jgi:hypothetical protein
VKGCVVCGGRHDDRLHSAALNARKQLRREIAAALRPVARPKIQTNRQPGGIIISPSRKK